VLLAIALEKGLDQPRAGTVPAGEEPPPWVYEREPVIRQLTARMERMALRYMGGRRRLFGLAQNAVASMTEQRRKQEAAMRGVPIPDFLAAVDEDELARMGDKLAERLAERLSDEWLEMMMRPAPPPAPPPPPPAAATVSHGASDGEVRDLPAAARRGQAGQQVASGGRPGRAAAASSESGGRGRCWDCRPTRAAYSVRAVQGDGDRYDVEPLRPDAPPAFARPGDPALSIALLAGGAGPEARRAALRSVRSAALALQGDPHHGLVPAWALGQGECPRPGSGREHPVPSIGSAALSKSPPRCPTPYPTPYPTPAPAPAPMLRRLRALGHGSTRVLGGGTFGWTVP
jgi:hypothetical protein